MGDKERIPFSRLKELIKKCGGSDYVLRSIGWALPVPRADNYMASSHLLNVLDTWFRTALLPSRLSLLRDSVVDSLVIGHHTISSMRRERSHGALVTVKTR